MSNKYILPSSNLGINYPSWAAYNYKQYKQKKEPYDPEVDLCKNVSKESGNISIRPYQEFVQKYMKFESPFRGILIYHGLGVGKTATSIYVYNELYNTTKNWNVYILVKKSLFKGWQDELNTFLEKNEFKDRLKNVKFINYDSSNLNVQFQKVMNDQSNVGKNNLYIIDEVHNFIRSVYSNISNQHSTRALEVYEHIQRDLNKNPNTRIMCISGTPVINKPYELGLLFNLLRKDSFPNKEDEFNNIFLKNEYSDEINLSTINLFQRRILGLVSYYDYFNRGLFASREEINVKLEMSDYHKKVYSFYEDIETKLEKKKSKFKSKNSTSLFKVYTRQSCNFVFPYFNKNMNGETRPRPNIIKKSLASIESQVEKYDKNNLHINNKEKALTIKTLKLYKKECDAFIAELIKLWDSLNNIDKKNGLDILKSIDLLKEKYIDDIKSFIKHYSKKSKLCKSMYDSSPKMLYMCYNILLNPGNVLIYSNFVRME